MYLGNSPKDPISVSTNAPAVPKDGDVWFNSALGETFVYYDDGNTSQWVQLNPSGQQGPAGPTGPAGANGEVVRTELDAYLQVANSTSFASSTDLDAYLQVANSTSFATTNQLDGYLQVANLSNISSSLVPSANVTYDLGSTTNYWKDLYLSGNTIFLGSSRITLNANGGIDLPSGSRMGGTLIGSGSGGGASVTIADTAPGSPSAGDLWWSANTSELFIYYNDTDTSQWVQATTPGATGATGAAGADGSSVTSYANTSAFPSSGNSVGDFAFATNTKAVYIWDGSEWDKISSGSDESPIITTEPPSSHTLSSTGNTTSITMVAEDPEGFDIEYGIKYNTAGGVLPDQLAANTVINQATGVFTFTPSSNTDFVGSFNARLTASDGNRVTVRTVPIELVFGYQYFRLYITAKRGSDLDLQLGEIEFTDENGVVSFSGATSNQGAMIDGTFATKAWQRITPTTSNPAIWTITLASPITLVSYRMGTADDYSARDPWNWEIQASYDNSTWTTLHTVTAGGGQLPTNRNTWSPAYTL